ncbi:DnaJ domain-containing protein [Parasponia andersonii]|uniref:DnaJ domain-containing protein n=1 Tax=Parasponia andersonii TaxID=3476 RepID=A0A2P5AQH7_PARAD|nr:DnaJ domain-containing protein [Parasponia andersonii]
MESPPRNDSGSNSFLGQSVHCLAQRDFLGCKKHAIQAQESDPNVAGTGEVLAIAGVIHAAERRFKNNRLDYYAILRITRTESENRQLVWTQFTKLVTLVNPRRNRYPFSTEAFNLLLEAWSLFSDPEKKTQYDIEVGDEPGVEKPGGEPSRGNGSGFGSGSGEEKNETFWTVCPYCYFMFEYGKVYQGRCLRCQTCQRGFHGVAISPPTPEIMVPGKDGYYLCYGAFPLGYSEESKDKKVNDGKGEKGLDHEVVEISDDDDSHGGKPRKSNDSSSIDSTMGNGPNGEDLVDGFLGKEVKNGVVGVRKGESFSGEIGRKWVRVGGKWPKKIVKAPARRMKHVKSVALNKNKMVGNPMRNRSFESEDDDIDMGIGGLEVNVDKGKGIMYEARDGDEGARHEDGNGGLVFFDGEDDVFVGLADSPI